MSLVATNTKQHQEEILLPNSKEKVNTTTNMGKTVKRQMSEATKGRALGLLEAGWGVTEVANRVNVSRCTISRLKSRKAADNVNDVPPRRK